MTSGVGCFVPVDRIEVRGRRRPVNPTYAISLAESIAQVGLLQPIVLMAGDPFVLVSGAHRLEAVRRLGREDIRAIVYQPDELDAELAEIDENLIRNELTALEHAEHTARRKQIYEARHPQAKRGTAGGVASGSSRRGERTTAESAVVQSFVADTAVKTGVAERTVYEDVQIATAIPEDVREKIHGTELADRKTDLLNLAKMPEEQQRKVVEVVAAGQATVLADAVRQVKRSTVVAKLEDVQTKEAKAASGLYDVIVVDPPWVMEKIDRDERPNQVGFEYPTMTVSDIKALPIPHALDCHLWLWTTQRYLPEAFEVLKVWQFRYVCAFVWHKPGGFQVVGLPQFNCEFALYARRGNPQFVDTKAFSTCFDGKRGAHSEKPEEFYEMVRRVTAGRRLDMFNRRAIEGFDGWGKEAVA